MNSVQRQDWLKTVEECRPAWRLAGLSPLLARWDGAAAGGVWEGGISNRPESKTLAVRYFGKDSEFPAWKRAASEIGGDCAVGDAPARGGLPWLTVVWDAAEDRPARVGPSLQTLSKPDRFDPRAIEDPALAKVLADFHALCPIRDLVFQFSAAASGESRPLPSWSLRLAEPLAWPLFLRLDMAASFAAESSQFSFFLLDRRVSELEFEGGAIWAYFRE
jgi:hypothetical protein